MVYRTITLLIFLSSPALARLQADSLTSPVGSGSPVTTGLALFGGLAVPTGEFGSSDGGGAEIGYGLGAALTIGLGIGGETWGMGLTVEASFLSFGTDAPDLGSFGINVESGSWQLIMPVAGPTFSFALGQSTGLDLFAGLGVLFGNSPSTSISGFGQQISIASASATAMAYSAGASLVFSRRFVVGLRYYGGSPEYEIETSLPGIGTQTATVEQSASALLLSVGYIFKP